MDKSALGGSGEQLPLPLPHRSRVGGWPFIEAPCNSTALGLLRRHDEWPDGRLVLHGEAGAGKSHLLRWWAACVGAEIEPGAGLTFPRPPSPSPAPLGPLLVRAIAVDDADAAPEETLLHVLNEAAEARRKLLLTARATPARWPVRLPDLASRLRASLSAELGPPDDALLAGLLARLLADRQMRVPETLQDWIRVRLPRQPAALQLAVERLDQATLAEGRRVDRPLAAAIVDEVERMWQPVLS